MCNSNQEQSNINTDKPVLVQAKYLSTRCPGALNIPHKKLVGQFPSSDAIFFLTTAICGRSWKHCIFAGKPVLKIILYRKGLTKGYSTYGGSK